MNTDPTVDRYAAIPGLTVAQDASLAPTDAPAGAEAPTEASAAILAAASAPEPLSAVPVARIVGGKARHKAFPLAYPVEFDGKVYSIIVLSRPSARQVGEFFEELDRRLSADPEARLRFPVYFDDAAKPVPEAVLDALDDDDMQEILGSVGDFLPKRLRAPEPTPAEPSSSPQNTGAATAPTSGE